MLKTFVNSTRERESIKGYEFPQADNESVSRLAASRASRVLDDIPAVVQGNSLHSIWLLKEGHRSSLTVPLYDRDLFIGFLFTTPAGRQPSRPRCNATCRCSAP